MMQQTNEKNNYLTAERILKYLLNQDSELETLITCGAGERMITTDQSLYEALGSIRGDDPFFKNRLVKFLEMVDVLPYKAHFRRPKKVLTEERILELRQDLLKEEPHGTNKTA